MPISDIKVPKGEQIEIEIKEEANMKRKTNLVLYFKKNIDQKKQVCNGINMDKI